MNPDRIADLLDRWRELLDPRSDPQLAAITLAVLVEDVFDVTLPEEALDLQVLSDPSSLSTVLDRLIGAC